MKAGKVEPALKSFKDGKGATPPKPPAQGAQYVAPAGSHPHHSTSRGRVKWGGGRRVGRKGVEELPMLEAGGAEHNLGFDVKYMRGVPNRKHNKSCSSFQIVNIDCKKNLFRTSKFQMIFTKNYGMSRWNETKNIGKTIEMLPIVQLLHSCSCFLLKCRRH